MKEVSRCYYFKDGRLDLSVLEEEGPLKTNNIKQNQSLDCQSTQIYMDDSIASIFEEMGNYFMSEEND